MATSLTIRSSGGAVHSRPDHSMGLRERYKLDKTKNRFYCEIPNGPEIGYNPDFSKYQERKLARIRAGNLDKEVPTGWPKHLDSPLAWTGGDFEAEEQYVHYLSREEKSDIDKALENFNELELNGHEVNRSTFPLSVLGPCLEEARSEVCNGRGFVILRGINPDDYSPEDLTVVFLGVSSYISEQRGKQDKTGRMLTHLVDCAASCNHAGVSPTRHSSIAQPFHADSSCDIIGILTRECAEKGGRSALASSWAVYNELAKTRPDIIHVLAKDDWPLDNFGRDPPYIRRALLYHQAPNVILSFARPPLTGHHATPRSAGIPKLSESQAEALDAVHFTAQSHQLVTTMERGDIRFINNLALLHGREPFDDGQHLKRHLVRLWLRDEKNGWPLPPAMKVSWARVFDDQERHEIWDIEPPVDWKIIRHFEYHGD